MKQLPHLSQLICCSLALIISAATLILTSCGGAKKDPNKDYAEITPDAITCIRASKAITVRFKQDDGKPKITVVSKKALTSSVDVHMEGSILVATIKNDVPIPESGVDVIVVAPSVNEIEADMAAIVNLGDELKLSGDLKIKCNHAGNVKCKRLTCNNLILQATNAGVIQLSSITATDLTARATNSATIMLDGKTVNSTIQKGEKTVVYAEKLETKNGHVETVQNTPLPAPPKKPSAPATKPTVAKDSAKVAQKPVQTSVQKATDKSESSKKTGKPASPKAADNPTPQKTADKLAPQTTQKTTQSSAQ